MNDLNTVYGDEFYRLQETGSEDSAAIVAPIVVNVLKPQSMVDIGCGVGHWVEAFRSRGVAVCHGVDGPWARSDRLRLSASDFVEFDFGATPAPFRPPLPQERYDLVTTFEFVEHIDPDKAEAIVDLLCSLADAVILGGAISNQGGTHHVNEQWPSYWAEKFARRGYAVCDFIRPAIWDNPRVEPWYAQNALAFFKGAVPANVMEAGRNNWARFSAAPPDLAHPRIWESRMGDFKWLEEQQRVSLVRKAARRMKRMVS